MTNQVQSLCKVVIWVCEGCLTRMHGQCHMPGCLFWMLNIEEVPDLRYACEVLSVVHDTG